MAGIYFHIPFCKQACHYCDFHFSTSLKNKNALLSAMQKELEQRAPELKEKISTIYFGGGTPSLLSKAELNSLIEICRTYFDLESDVEICLEANPDDLNKEKLDELLEIGIDRLSIGLQSFDDDQLKKMNRAHSADESTSCVRNAQSAGFKNLSIDLIYALPGLTDKHWQDQLEQATALNVQHISAYCLTIEPRTALHHFVQKGKVAPADESTESRHFEMTMDAMATAGFDHYEISNFGKPGFWSRHNTSYWKGKPYLGIGPSAHSFNGAIRRWNVANNSRYIMAIEENEIYFEQELLSDKDRFNESIMLGLRTSWGVELNALQNETGLDMSAEQHDILKQRIKDGYLMKEGEVILLTWKGKFIADHIASELFMI